jgi:acetyltransferase-like isoleucine patch superfamily enzyme
LDDDYPDNLEYSFLERHGIIKGFLQLFLILFMGLLLASPVFPAVLSMLYISSMLGNVVSPSGVVFNATLFLLPSMILILQCGQMIVVVVCKWLVLGKARAGKYKLWSPYFCRWWFINRMQRYLSFSVLGNPWGNGTVFAWIFFLSMGGNIHWSATVREEIFDADLVTLMEDSGSEAVITAHEFCVGGFLVLDRITFEKRSWLGYKSRLYPGSSIPEGCKVFEGTLIYWEFLQGESKPPTGSVLWKSNPVVVSDSLRFKPNLERDNFLLWCVKSLVIVVLRAWLFWMAVIPFLYLFFVIGSSFGTNWLLLSLCALIPFVGSCYLVLILITKWILLGRVREGSYHWKGSLAFRRDIFLAVADVMLRGVFNIASFMWSFSCFLRLLGVSMGKGCLVGGFDLLAEWDLIVIGAHSFLGGLSFFKCWEYDNSRIKFSKVLFGEECTLGGSSIIIAPSSFANRSVITPGSVLQAGIYGRENQVYAGKVGFSVGESNSAPIIPKGENELAMFLVICVLCVILGGISAIAIEIGLVLPASFFSLTGRTYFFFSLLYSITYLLFQVVFSISSLVVGFLVLIVTLPLIAKRTKQLPFLKFFATVVGIGSRAAICVGGTAFAVYIWRLFGARVGRNCYIDTESFAPSGLIKMNDDCILQCNLNLGFADRTDPRQPGLILGKGTVLQRDSRVVDGLETGEFVEVVPLTQPDNLRKIPNGWRVRDGVNVA